MATISAAGVSMVLPADTTKLGNLRSSFGKFRRGEAISIEEKVFLQESSRLAPSLLDKISSCLFTNAAGRRAEEIDGIAGRILAGRGLSKPLLDEVETLFLRENTEAPQVVASLSRLLTTCLETKRNFTTEVADFRRDQRREPTRLDLIVLVNRCNEIPDLTKAGTEAASIGNMVVKYDERGFLRIEQGCLTPIDLECRQRLTRAQVEEMKRLYAERTRHISYNNLGEMLDFMRYYMEGKATNPSLTLDEAIRSYSPDLPGIFAKYHSGGTCLVLSASFCVELASRGIIAESTGQYGMNRWSALPLPTCPEILWPAFSEEVRYMHHTRTSCFYRDEEDCKQVIVFEGSFEANTSQDVKETDLEKFLDTYSMQCEVYYPERVDPSEWARSQSPFQVPDAIADPSVIYKGRLKGRFKAVMEAATDSRKILGVDFLRGNFYINPSWSRTLTGLPLNEKGIASIDLIDLAHPDEVGVYFIDGERREITHRAALRIILDKTRDDLYFPEDFEENLLALAENTDNLFTDFFLEPMQTIKLLYEDFSALSRKMSQARNGLTTAAQVSAFQPTADKFDALVEDIRKNKEAAARIKLAELNEDLARFATAHSPDETSTSSPLVPTTDDSSAEYDSDDEEGGLLVAFPVRP